MSVLDDEFAVDAELGHKTEKVSALLRLGNELIDNIRKTIYEYDDPKKSAYPSAYQIENALRGVNISIEQFNTERTDNISIWSSEAKFRYEKAPDNITRYQIQIKFDYNHLLDDATLWIYSDAETSQNKEHWLMDQFCYIAVISMCITLGCGIDDAPLSKRFDFSGIVR